jgi:hypothetical protein
MTENNQYSNKSNGLVKRLGTAFLGAGMLASSLFGCASMGDIKSYSAEEFRKSSYLSDYRRNPEKYNFFVNKNKKGEVVALAVDEKFDYLEFGNFKEYVKVDGFAIDGWKKIESEDELSNIVNKFELYKGKVESAVVPCNNPQKKQRIPLVVLFKKDNLEVEITNIHSYFDWYLGKVTENSQPIYDNNDRDFFGGSGSGGFGGGIGGGGMGGGIGGGQGGRGGGSGAGSR